MSDAYAAAKALADFWPASAMLSPETGLPLCIETTRIVVAAFARAGVPDVHPLPCALRVYNGAAFAKVMASGSELEVEGATVVEINPDRKPPKGSRGWPGHLVVEHPDFLLDLVLPAVIAASAPDDPSFGHVGPFIAEKGRHAIEASGSWFAVDELGTTVQIEPRRRLARWKNTDAWRSTWNRADLDVVDTVGAVIAAAVHHERERLATAEGDDVAGQDVLATATGKNDPPA